jgi:hypothetical protein
MMPIWTILFLCLLFEECDQEKRQEGMERKEVKKR